jgi:hypothetical protein
MSFLIEIKSTAIQEKNVRSKEGKEYLIREQSGWAHLGKDYPQEVRVPLEAGKPAYAPGTYAIEPGCLYVDRFGRLTLGRLRLTAFT